MRSGQIRRAVFIEKSLARPSLPKLSSRHGDEMRRKSEHGYRSGAPLRYSRYRFLSTSADASDGGFHPEVTPPQDGIPLPDIGPALRATLPNPPAVSDQRKDKLQIANTTGAS
ncbi:hypothetical protein SKAU_G00296780 [Synaphobranchus kaupii]|uniref:Uncharacterized protein n=1 Tax=Synaphobranchus kaupii TaxID=118154 RepID=A0A9Q1EUZ0_SYNKA|nr:hypothetical protein SKAU_G00296780 [Synaphobranchus kaupii]